MALAEVLQLDEGAGGATRPVSVGDALDDAVAMVIGAIRMQPANEALDRIGRYQSRLMALEAELLAARKRAGASDRNLESALGRGSKTTKRDAKLRARRAAAVHDNPSLGDRLATGDLGADQLDAIADAAVKTDGLAATADDLIESIVQANPDDAKALAKRWVEDHKKPDQRESERQRQRRLRSVSRYVRDNVDGFRVEGDTDSVEAMWKVLTSVSRSLFTKDGGRDLAPGKHLRTRNQRLFDAAHQLITRPSAAGGASTGANLNLWVQLDDFCAGDSSAHDATGRIVPEAVVERHMCNGTIAGTVFDAQGEVLYHGRRHRYATPGQVRALVDRDKHCVLCHAPASECEAHHLIPWNALLRGKTDIDGLALVCSDCHHHIHDNKLTLYRTHQRGQPATWQLRPATPDEIPPRHQRHRHKLHHTRRPE